jgi:hypothetical protein
VLNHCYRCGGVFAVAQVDGEFGGGEEHDACWRKSLA